MTKEQFIKTIRLQHDKEFLIDIVNTALDQLSPAIRNTLIEDYYTKYVYDGDVYILTHAKTGVEYYLAGLEEVHKFFSSINTKYSTANFFRARKDPSSTIYGYYIKKRD